MMNLFTPTQLPEPGSEFFEILHQNEHMKIERITSNGLNQGEWYDQEHDEWISLLQGEATLEFEQGKKELIAGDTLLIEKHQRHRVWQTSSDAIWLAIHLNS